VSHQQCLQRRFTAAQCETWNGGDGFNWEIWPSEMSGAGEKIRLFIA